MASAWGDSWGGAWGSAWLAPSAVQVPPLPYRVAVIDGRRVLTVRDGSASVEVAPVERRVAVERETE